MNYNYDAMQSFLRKYRGSPKHKMEIVKEYQNKYDWDPVKLLHERVKEDFLRMKLEGRSTKDIEAIFKDDPFVKIGPIRKAVDKLD